MPLLSSVTLSHQPWLDDLAPGKVKVNGGSVKRCQWSGEVTMISSA